MRLHRSRFNARIITLRIFYYTYPIHRANQRTSLLFKRRKCNTHIFCVVLYNFNRHPHSHFTLIVLSCAFKYQIIGVADFSI